MNTTKNTTTITLTVRPSTIFFKRGSSEDVNRGESVDAALDRHIEEVMDAAREDYMDGHGYGTCEMPLREVMDSLRWDRLSLSRRKKHVAALRAAQAEYGDSIPTSCGPFGFEFGNEASDEETLCDGMELAWHQREKMEVTEVSYIIESCAGADLNDVLNAAGRLISHSHLRGDVDGCDDLGEIEMPDGSTAYIAVQLA